MNSRSVLNAHKMDSSLNRSEYRASNTLQSFKLPAEMRGRNGINARNRNFAPAILQFLEKNLALIRVILVNAGRMPAACNKYEILRSHLTLNLTPN